MSHLNIAILQAVPPSDDPSWDVRRAANLARMDDLVGKVRASNPLVDLAVFPEHYLPGLKGLVAPDPFPADVAEPLDGALVQEACAIARRHGVWLIPGTFMEAHPDGQAPYNTALLISPEGEIKLTYRKIIIPRPLEPSSHGSEYPVYEIPGVGVIGILICADSSWPETARNLALNGAEVIFRPNAESDWIAGRDVQQAVAQTRAFENQCYFVGVNTGGPIGMGESIVVNPEGGIDQKLGPGELWTVAYLNFDEVRRVREQGTRTHPMLKLLRDAKLAGNAVDKCYLDGLENAPVFATLKHPTPQSPAEVRKIWPPDTNGQPTGAGSAANASASSS